MYLCARVYVHAYVGLRKCVFVYAHVYVFMVCKKRDVHACVSVFMCTCACASVCGCTCVVVHLCIDS